METIHVHHADLLEPGQEATALLPVCRRRGTLSLLDKESSPPAPPTPGTLLATGLLKDPLQGSKPDLHTVLTLTDKSSPREKELVNQSGFILAAWQWMPLEVVL